ncbi:MAG: hypothetical protein ACM3ZE_28380 [Myxococcales bacterium]
MLTCAQIAAAEPSTNDFRLGATKAAAPPDEHQISQVTPQLAVPDSVTVEASSSTYIPLFQRALMPGPAGAVASPATGLPVYEYLMLRVIDADTPWAKNSIDTELSLWGSASVVGTDVEGRGGERRIDGDVSVAAVTHRLGPGFVKLGRQYVTGGAARFAHLDGISAAYRSEWGFMASGYAGYTALPRWYHVPNYRLLGSATDSMVQRPEDFPRASRSGNWMAGGRLGYSQPKYGEIGVSLHEQHENSALGRRDVAVDLHLPGSETLDGDARVLFDLDSGKLADGFVGLGWHPVRRLDLALDYRRMTPTLLMSRQSVLSVFAVDRFDELGGEARYRVGHGLVVFAGSFVEWFESGDYGVRVRSGVRATPDDKHRLLVNAVYTRVTEPLNGYHSTRLSLGYRLAVPVYLTAEQYCYLYDRAIHGAKTSTVHALTASYRPQRAWEILLGGSLFSSPYAALDAQTMLRLVYTAGAAMGGEP